MSKRKRIPYGLALTKLALHSALTAHQKLVLIVLAEHLGINDHAWPSYARLARLTSLSRPTVIKTVKALAEAGILAVSYPPGERSNHYIPDLQELMNRVDDEQVKERFREGLGHPERADGKGASPSTGPGSEAMVKELDRTGKASLPALVKELYRAGKEALPERPNPTPQVKRPPERPLRRPPQP